MNNLKKPLRLALFFITIVSAVQAVVVAQAVELDYNFRGGDVGWTAGFADYPPATDRGIYELEARLRFIPRKVVRKPQLGFYFQGHNRSDD
jgi:hypothetical protein